MTWWQLCLLFLVADRLLVLLLWSCWAGFHTYKALRVPTDALIAHGGPQRGRGLRWMQNGPTRPS